MLTGDSGIIKQAQDAKNNTIIEDEKEGISLAYMACKQNNMFSKEVTDEELQDQMHNEGRNVTVTIWGEDLIVVYNETNNKYKISQTGEIEKQKNLTEEEARRVVDVVTVYDDDIYVLTAGGEVKLANRTSGNIFDELDSDSTELITTNGVKSKGKHFFIDNKGKVYTWGENNYGQLGNGTRDYNGSSEPICISDLEGNVLNGKTIVAILEGDSYKVAIDKNGKVYTWGRNMLGELGNGGMGDSSSPICISDIEGSALEGKNIIDINRGSYELRTIIARDIDGKIYTWGIGQNGGLGNGTTDYSEEPICISDIDGNALKGKRITDVYSGSDAIIAKDVEGKIYAWGKYSRLGNGTTEGSTEPICISDIEGNALNGKNITDVYYSEYALTIIAKDVDGKIYTWGSNGSGQLGNGTAEDSTVPICISDIEGNALNGKNITDIYFDGYTTIAKDTDGKIYTWGENYDGQLGNGTIENSTVPICISDIEGNALNGKNIKDICFAGYTTIIAKDTDGKIYTWGDNSYGQLGDGTTENSNVPICISDIEDSELKDKVVQNIIYEETDSDEYYIYYLYYVTEDDIYIHIWTGDMVG